MACCSLKYMFVLLPLWKQMFHKQDIKYKSFLYKKEKQDSNKLNISQLCWEKMHKNLLFASS